MKKSVLEIAPADIDWLIVEERGQKPGVAPNRLQIVTGSQKHRDTRYLPYAFTEHGAIMAANVLNSQRAVQMRV